MRMLLSAFYYAAKFASTMFSSLNEPEFNTMEDFSLVNFETDKTLPDLPTFVSDLFYGGNYSECNELPLASHSIISQSSPFSPSSCLVRLCHF